MLREEVHCASESDVFTNIIVISATGGAAADYSTQINPKSVRSSSRVTDVTENCGNYLGPLHYCLSLSEFSQRTVSAQQNQD